MEIDSDYEYCENSPAPKAKAPKAKAAKAAAPLGNSNAANLPAAGGKKAIEDIYQKKTQLEHILLRPDTYIGSTEKQQAQLWVHNGSEMVYKNVSYTPGLYKIFDEILVNAADNKVRDPTMDTLRVDINPESNMIRVWNNGDGIPVEVHKEEGVYVPELIFGHLLTSSNYDDQEKKVTGGRNGFGAKLCNIFSTRFEVETCDGKRQRRFHQVFTGNMGTKTAPKITACKASDNWTCISFQPDLAKFDMTELEEDTVALMRKRVYDVAGVLGKGCKVYLNGMRLPIKSFQEYCELYLGPKEDGVARVYERINDRWEVCFSATDGAFQQVSFVNSICTNWGGTHVNYVVDQVSKYLVEKLAKKHKKANVKPAMVKNHLWVFVNSQIENPAFSSQTKDMLTSRQNTFGSKCELSPALLEKVGKAGVMDNILSFAESKNQRELKKGDGAKRSRLTGIAKLSDANAAGTAGSQRCTLILTEGDSAKSLAMSGLSVVGHDHYGVFPLRGKLLNVRDATATQVAENQEIQNLKQILGLQYKKQYSDTKSLRYGHLMIMTDQDHDGSHIKGLIMNFLHAHYPELLQLPGFLAEFITPIVKARKGRQEIAFYTMPEYENWKESLGAAAGSWDIKYYKGLGTSSPAEAKQYFANMDQHKKLFVWEGEEDGAAIEMAFSKKKVEERKAWLSAFQPGTYLDQSVNTISYSDFVHKELILFSRADLERSIPSMVDGLKPGQRKILFCCFKRNLVKDVKVAQLSGYVSEHSAYHHGEASLQSTIVGLAQDFVGSNNINLLFPSGQFGTRLMGGKDAASPRYIYTRLAPLTRHLFPKADDKVLNYLTEEGQAIEPEWYMPILPMVLINGAEGIGTGWSTYIPNYSPRQVAANLLHLLRGEPMEDMQPWYRGFNGSVVEVPTRNAAGKSYAVSGTAVPAGDNALTITELPVRTWTQSYKEFLETLMKPPAAAARGAGTAAGAAAAAAAAEGPLLADYMEHHTDVSVHFDLQLVPGKLEALQASGALDTKLKLTSKISTGNMMLFDAEGRIKRYDTPEEVLLEFFDLRLQYYELRRVALLGEATWEHRRASNKIRFILAVIQGQLVVNNRKKADIEGDLEAMGFDKLTKSNPSSGGHAAASAAAEAAAAEAEGGEAAAAAAKFQKESYDYLLSMQIWNLTYEKVQALQGDADTAAAEVARLEQADIRSMWIEDLENFLVEYEKWEEEANAAAALLVKQRKGAKGGGGGGKAKGAAGGAKAGAKGKKANPWSDEESDEEEDMDYQEFKAPKPRAAPKPPAARAPKAAAAATKLPAAAGPSSSTATTSTAPGMQPVYTVKTAAPPKPGSKAAAAAAAKNAAAVAAAAAAADAAPPAAAVPAASQASDGTEMSLAERLKAMALQNASEGVARQRPGRAAAAQAAKKVAEVVELSGSEEDASGASSSEGGDPDSGSDWGAGSDSEQEVMSPAPAVLAARAAAPAAGRGRGRGKVAAAAAAVAPGSASKGASPGVKVAFGRTVSAAPPPPAAAAAKPAAKRKPRGRKVVSESSDEEPSFGVPASPACYEAPTPSPAVARQKVRKTAVSPIPLPKGIGRTAPAPKAPAAAAGAAKRAPAAAKKKTNVISLDSDEEEEGTTAAAAAAAPAPRAAPAAGGRARRAPVRTYAESDDDEEMSEDQDEGSDYCASD